MNINWIKSADLNKMNETGLREHFKQYPGSHKRIAAICEMCGGERNVRFQQYRQLCLKCSHNTTECRLAKSERGTKQFEDPQVRKRMSDIKKQYYIDNPDGRMKPHTNHPRAWDDAYERQRGGDDICDHHMIYDHADRGKYIMKMTRTTHSRLHRVFGANGIKIPHINVRPENVNTFKGIKMEA